MDTNTASEIGRKVDGAIQAAGRSKASVADESGIPWATFSRKINGHSEFTASEMIRVAQVIDVPAATFLPAAFRSAVAA